LASIKTAKPKKGDKAMASQEASSKKLVAGILAILLGAFGIHKFYLGYVVAGIIQIVLSLICGIGGIIGLIEGIMYLIKSDDEFEAKYINGDKKAIKFF
jgi:TM2 domain-containing membrane protein YozV